MDITLASLANLGKSMNRGFVTGLLGGPVDLANLAMGGRGGDAPVMGSKWIGDKLAGAGLLPPEQEGLTGTVGELAGGLVSPGAPFKLAALAKTPALAAILATVKNPAELKQAIAAAGYKGKFGEYAIDDATKAKRAEARDFLINDKPEPYKKPESTLLDYSEWDSGQRPDMSAFSTIGQDDKLARKVGPRALGRVNGILDDTELHDLQVLGAKRGQRMGGDYWYNLQPLYAKFKEYGLPDRDFASFVANNYALSAQTPVLPNIAHATLAGYLEKQGLLTPDMKPKDAAMLMREQLLSDTGKKAMISRAHLDKVLDFMRNGQFEQGFDGSQKFAGYGHGLAGFTQPVALDTHEVRFMANMLPEELGQNFFKMGPKGKPVLDLLSPQEYHAVERLYQDRLAPMAGMQPADFQANRWVGAGPLTGLVSPPIPFADAVERLVAWNAQQRGLDPQQLLRNVLSRDAYLYPYRARNAQLPTAAEILR